MNPHGCRNLRNPGWWTWLFAVAVTAAALLPARAQAAPPAPAAPATQLGATRPAELAQPQTVTITGIEGLVEVRAGDGKPWAPAKLGMVVGEGAEFRTGTRSVRFIIPPDQVATLDRLGTVKVLTAIRSAKRVKTDLGMKYGRVRYDIEGGGIEHESTIYSPGATLAVRGTKVSLTNEPPFAPSAASLTGRAQFATDGHPPVPLGGEGFAQADADYSSAATFSFNQTINPAGGVPAEALTSTELFQWGQYPGVGTTLNTQIAQSARGGQLNMLFQSAAAMTAANEGGTPLGPIGSVSRGDALIFFLLSTGLTNTDLAVLSPLGEAVGPAGGPALSNHALATQVSSGGFYITNPSPKVLTSGIASGYAVLSAIVWPTSIPAGTYTVGAINTGSTAANIRLYTYSNSAFGAPFSATANPHSGYVTTQINVR